jgi:hypothetical protein
LAEDIKYADLVQRNLTGVAGDGYQQSPFNDALVEVELKYPCRCFPFRREWLDYGSPKHEMIIPTLAPRVEESDKRAALSVQRTDIAALPRIASKASHRRGNRNPIALHVCG